MSDEKATRNIIRVKPNGSLKFEGNLKILLPDGSVEYKQRAGFCRCGASKLKPFCDSAHHEAGWVEEGRVPDNRDRFVGEPDIGGELLIMPLPNGPLLVHGYHEVMDMEETSVWCDRMSAFCRCGNSHIKPFCDGRHAGAGFKAEGV